MSYTVVLNNGHSFNRQVDHLQKTVVDAIAKPLENNGDDCLLPSTVVSDSPDAPTSVQHSSRIRHSPDHYMPKHFISDFYLTREECNNISPYRTFLTFRDKK